MKYSNEDLKGLPAPPLINGQFCIHTFKQWKTVNKLWPWEMTFEQWRDWNDKTSKLSDNPHVRADQEAIRLTILKHWFHAIEERIRQGGEIDSIVLADYKARGGYTGV